MTGFCYLCEKISRMLIIFRNKLSNLLYFILVLLMSCNGTQKKEEDGESLLVYAGAASKPAVEEIVPLFEKKFNTDVEILFGGSGFVLSQMKLSGKGDVYFPGSSDYMEIAKREGLVYPETEKKLVYLVNAINVQKGNPKGIHSIHDLCKPGIRVALANPEGVCLGTYSVELLEKNLDKDEIKQFRTNLLNYTESCDKTAAVIALKSADAVIGWRVFQYWNPDKIKSIPIEAKAIQRIGYIPAAVSTLSKNKDKAQHFIDFLCSEEASEIFRKYHYFTSVKEAEEYLQCTKPVGGEYNVPASWIDYQ